MKQFFYFGLKLNLPMKNLTWSLLCILFISLFIKAGCSASEDDLEPPTPNTDQYITWNFASIKGQLTAPPDSILVGNFYTPSTTDIFASSRTGNTYAYAAINGNTTGTFPLYLSIFTGGKYYNSTAPSSVTISTYGSSGGYIIGTYTGKIKDSTSPAVYDMSGMFRVKK